MRKISALILVMALSFGMAGVSVAKPTQTKKPAPKETIMAKVDCDNPKTDAEFQQCIAAADAKATDSRKDATDSRKDADKAKDDVNTQRRKVEDSVKGTSGSSSSSSSSSASSASADATVTNPVQQLAEVHGFKGEAKISANHELLSVADVIKNLPKTLSLVA